MTTTLAPVQLIRFEISDGPGIDRLIEGFKYVYDQDVVLNTKFQGMVYTGDGTSQYMEYDAQIEGIRYYESGRPGVFIIKVNIKNFKSTEGFYNAKTRKGCLHLERNS